MRVLIVLALAALSAACNHPQEIVGRGDIVSSTGLHDCTLEEQPCANLIAGGYHVTYSAVPRPGWRFVGWEGCNSFPQCTVNVDAATVERFVGWTTPALVARFEPMGQERPNILTIMADDLGFNDLAINNGNTSIHTPNMDRLAREGVRFTRHYASSVCSPARASFLTGIVPERLGYIPNGPGISPQHVTLAERLQQEGYTTWHIGKWHIGDIHPAARPGSQGFDHWFGFLNQWRLSGTHVDGVLKLEDPRYEDPWLEGDDAPGQHYAGHLESLLTEKAEDVLTMLDAEGGPWFLNLWFFAPHSPISPAAEFAAQYPDNIGGRYRALVHQLDHNIGRVIARLEELGQLENTIVVVVSDNGGAHFLANNESNHPFLGGKQSLQEGGLRTPLIVRWPQKSMAGQVYDGIVSIEDIYPTLLEAINVSVPQPIDGSSFLSAIQDGEPLQRPLFWEFIASSTNYSVMSADGRWKLVRNYWVQSAPQLFDEQFDPTFSWPVNKPQEVIDAMLAEYIAWFREVHEVGTEFVSDGTGGGVVVGLDLQRTPGLGPYTLGIGMPSGYEGKIVSQDGSWELSSNANTVTARFGALVLSGEVVQEGSCHSVVVTGEFTRVVSDNQEKDEFRLSLYIDGQEAQSRQVDGVLPVADVTLPIVVGDSSVPGNDDLPPPVILNRELLHDSVWTISEFSDEMCGQG